MPKPNNSSGKMKFCALTVSGFDFTCSISFGMWFRPAFGLLGADPRFVAARPDYTVALAERMAQAQRADLALRVLQPYVKEQQQHRLHLAGAPQRSAT